MWNIRCVCVWCSPHLHHHQNKIFAKSPQRNTKKRGKKVPAGDFQSKIATSLSTTHHQYGRYSMQAQPAAVSCTNIEAFTGTCFPHIWCVRIEKIRAVDIYSNAVYYWYDISACCRLIQLDVRRNSWIRKPSSLRQYRRFAIVMS